MTASASARAAFRTDVAAALTRERATLVRSRARFVGPERFKKNQWTFTLFGLMALIYALLFPGSPSPNNIPYDPLPSMQRFVLEVFAGFIVLARYGRRPWFHQSYLMLALPMLAFLVFQFITGHWTI